MKPKKIKKNLTKEPEAEPVQAEGDTKQEENPKPKHRKQMMMT